MQAMASIRGFWAVHQDPVEPNPPRDLCGGYFGQTISGGFDTQGCCSIRQDSFQHYFQILDNLSFVHGKHTIKFGPYARLAYFNSVAMVNDNGTLAFGTTSAFRGATPLEDFLTGTTTSGTTLVGNPLRNTQDPTIAAYIQDDWRVLPRLTVNAGLRYEYTWPFSNPSQNPQGLGPYQLGNFNPALGTATDLFQESKSTWVYHPYPGDISPRLGVAWDMFGNGKTVLNSSFSLMWWSSPYGIGALYTGGAVIYGIPTGFTFYDAANPEVRVVLAISRQEHSVLWAAYRLTPTTLPEVQARLGR